MFSRILVPLDGSEIAEGVIPYVTQLAAGLQAGVLLHTVVDPDPTSEQEVSEIEADLLKDFETGLMRVAWQIKDMGVEVNTVATIGRRPSEQILETAEAESCDLIALATHGRNAIGRGLLGSVTDRVVHCSTIPVLTISPTRAQEHPRGDDRIRNVIVPLDGSELGETVLPVVEALAEAMSLQVHLVRAFDPAEYNRRHRYSLAFAGLGSAEEELRAYHTKYLESVAESLRSKGLGVSIAILEGPTVREVVDYARKSPQDIVVMATHGRSGFRRLLLGSVTEAVIRTSTDPVLIVPPKASDV